MTVLKFNFGAASADEPPTGNWNLCGLSPTSAQSIVLSGSVIDDTGAIVTGVALDSLQAFGGDSKKSWAISMYDTWEKEVWNSYWYDDIAAGDVLRLSGLTESSSYTLTIAGARGNTGRNSVYDSSGNSGSAATYTDDSTTPPPASPVTISGTVPAGGNVDINLTGNDTTAYINGFTFEYTQTTILATFNSTNIGAQTGLSGKLYLGYDMSSNTLLDSFDGTLESDASDNIVIDMQYYDVLDGDDLILVLVDWTTTPVVGTNYGDIIPSNVVVT